jgi:hypothetical protein
MINNDYSLVLSMNADSGLQIAVFSIGENNLLYNLYITAIGQIRIGSYYGITMCEAMQIISAQVNEDYESPTPSRLS